MQMKWLILFLLNHIFIVAELQFSQEILLKLNAFRLSAGGFSTWTFKRQKTEIPFVRSFLDKRFSETQSTIWKDLEYKTYKRNMRVRATLNMWKNVTIPWEKCSVNETLYFHFSFSYFWQLLRHEKEMLLLGNGLEHYAKLLTLIVFR